MHHAQVRGKRPATREKDLGIWQTWTWAEVADEVRALACGLASLGFKRGMNLAIIGDNRPRLYWSMSAAQSLGGVAVPLYQDAVAEEMVYVLNDAEVHFAIVEKPQTKVNGIWGGRGGTDFVFDGGARGHLEFEAVRRAWLDGKDASASLRWLADAGYLRPEPPAGARTTFQGDGLPPNNASFGRRRVRAVLQEQGCACQSEPREVRIFYWANAENGPQGQGCVHP